MLGFCKGPVLRQITEMEDEDSLINEKFYDFECCPLCVTPDKLKEIEANA